MRLSTNINEVIDRETAAFQQLIGSDKVLREVAFDATAMISNRVQQEGKKSDGSKITTKAKEKFGAYSKSWGKKRAKNGRQTTNIDLTDTGDMMGDFVPEPTGENEYSVGFRGEKSSQKAEWNEIRFGDIFLPTEEEEKFIVESLNKKIDAIFK